MNSYKKISKDLENKFNNQIELLRKNTENYLMYSSSVSFKEEYDRTLEEINEIFNLQTSLAMELEMKNELIINDLKNINIKVQEDENINNSNKDILNNKKSKNNASKQIINDYTTKYNFEVLLLLGKFFSIVIILMFVRNLMINKQQKIEVNKEIEDVRLDIKTDSKPKPESSSKVKN